MVALGIRSDPETSIYSMEYLAWDAVQRYQSLPEHQRHSYLDASGTAGTYEHNIPYGAYLMFEVRYARLHNIR